MALTLTQNKLKNMTNCVNISLANLLYDPQVYNHHFLQVSGLLKNTANCQTLNCFCCMKSENNLSR